MKFIIFLFCLPSMFLSQCKVKSVVKDGNNLKSMSEMFWDSTKTRKYSEGVDGYYISTNKLNSRFYIVVTHLLLGVDDDDLPNKLTILFPSGSKIEKYAESYSVDTFNMIYDKPNDAKTRECYFIFTNEEIDQIISENKFESIRIENYKKDRVMQIITKNDIYAGQLSEMFSCLNR